MPRPRQSFCTSTRCRFLENDIYSLPFSTLPNTQVDAINVGNLRTVTHIDESYSLEQHMNSSQLCLGLLESN
jgi:hypothetical protein